MPILGRKHKVICSKDFIKRFSKVADIMNEIKQKYLDSLTKDDLLSIMKYGLRESNAPSDVTVEDIWHVIGCKYIEES